MILHKDMKIEIHAIDWIIGTSDSKTQFRVMDRISLAKPRTMELSSKLKLVFTHYT